jgi:uncharacterized membrane protein
MSSSPREAPRTRGGTDVAAERLARALGWFSLGLGVAQLAAPSAVNRMIGVPDSGKSRALQRLVGVREIASGVGIFAERRPAGWLWARVAGDVMDLALLAKAMDSRSASRPRVAAAMAAVAGVLVPDTAGGMQLSRAQGPGRPVRKAITVRANPDDVYAFWHDFENFPRFMAHLLDVEVTTPTTSHWKARGPAGRTIEWDAEIVQDIPGHVIAWRAINDPAVRHAGAVFFAPAPGDRGTEIRLEMRYDPPLGPVSVAVAKLTGEEPSTAVGDDLRRFKQVVETGEVVRSDGSPEGAYAPRLLEQRPAQPLGASGSGNDHGATGLASAARRAVSDLVGGRI